MITMADSSYIPLSDRLVNMPYTLKEELPDIHFQCKKTWILSVEARFNILARLLPATQNKQLI